MADRPNFLFFMTDHEQAQVLVPGHPCRTPHADRLGRAGVQFSRFYTPAAHCCPSRATLFTGLYPSRHGIYNNVCNDQAIHKSLYPGVRTFGEVLQEAGYNMAFAGKWHVCADENPGERGWRELSVSAGKSDRHGRSWDKWHELAQNYRQPDSRGDGEIIRPGWEPYHLYGTVHPSRPVDPPHRADREYRVIAEAVTQLREMAQGEQPWCLYIGLTGPHDPYRIPEPYASMYDPEQTALPPSYADTMVDKPRIYQRLRQQIFGQLSEAEVRKAIAYYWGYCTMLDDMLGEVLAALDETGCADNTVVMRLSDHGDYAGAHGLFAKGVASFDEAYHIPLIIRWPAGTRQNGRSIDEFATLADIAPTVLDLAGCPPLAETTGRSLAPFLRAEPAPDWPDAFFSQFNGVELYYSQRIVQTKYYKYVFNGFDFDELYDLQSDPYEMVNLAAQPEMRPILREMVGRLWQFAHRERDSMHHGYITVGLAPFGPITAFREDVR